MDTNGELVSDTDGIEEDAMVKGSTARPTARNAPGRPV